MLTTYHEIKHGHLFCGLGGGARGFNRGQARVGSVQAKFRCVGGVDVDPAAVRDFERLSGVRGTLLDLFDRGQYVAFHGKQPPREWVEVGPDDIRAAFGFERPDIVFLSPPCKGFSGLLSESKSKSGKYQALNGLTLRGLWLMLEAYKDDPIPLILLENVPRIASRGRHLLNAMTALLREYGYAVAETTHDCGELGGLAQSRKRFLLVARHVERVPSFLYQPVKRPLRAVGDVLSRMPRPGDPAAGPMHRIPRLQWKTWVRLALVEAGSDWRSLKRLAVEDGYLRDYGIMPESAWRQGILGVLPYDQPMGCIAGKTNPTNGRYAIADPTNLPGSYGKYAVTEYNGAAGTVISGSTTGQGAFAVADPTPEHALRNTALGVTRYADPSGCVTSRGLPLNGAFAIADPRPDWMGIKREADAYENIYRVVRFDAESKAVTGASHTAGGALSVADPRPEGWREGKENFASGPYGVVHMTDHSGTVAASNRYDNSYSSVADIRLPEPAENLVCCIIAPDNTWHRPFTTLELAALQGLMDPEEQLELDGLSDAAWRERIGNAVPPPAASAIAGVMGELLILTALGETFTMSQSPIWVRPMIAGLMAARRDVL